MKHILRILTMATACTFGLDIGATRAPDPLFLAVFRDDASAVRTLLDQGADVNALDENGRIPLMTAALEGSANAAEALLAAGADVAAESKPRRYTALHYAAEHGRPIIVRRLVRARAKIEATDSAGRTPLLLAAWAGHLETVEALIEAKPNANAEDARGQTALFLQIPLEDQEAGNEHPQPTHPTTRPSEKRNAMILSLLIKAGADINHRAKLPKGQTPLLAAASTGNTEAVKVLCENGADVTATNENDMTAMKMAENRRNAPMIEVLRRYLDKR
jgi:ankyrin repeat protein